MGCCHVSFSQNRFLGLVYHRFKGFEFLLPNEAYAVERPCTNNISLHFSLQEFWQVKRLPKSACRAILAYQNPHYPKCVGFPRKNASEIVKIQKDILIL